MSHQTNVAGRASWKDLPLACLSKWQYCKLVRYKAQHLRGCAPCPFLQVKSLALARCGKFEANPKQPTELDGSAGGLNEAGTQTDVQDVFIPNWLVFYEPHGSDVGVQTDAISEILGSSEGDSSTVRVSRITEGDTVINQYHRGALYLEMDIAIADLEHKCRDEASVKELRQTFDEWDKRMRKFHFVSQCDSCSQTVSISAVQLDMMQLQVTGASDLGTGSSKMQDSDAGVWRRIQRDEIARGVRVRIGPECLVHPGCRGAIQDSFWIVDDLMSGEPSYVCSVALDNGQMAEVTWVDVEVGPASHAGVSRQGYS